MEVAERYVDGFATEEECQRAADEAFEVERSIWGLEQNARKAVAFAAFDAANLEDRSRAFQAQGSVIYAVAFLAGLPWEAGKQTERRAAKEGEERKQAELLRCIVGNPFRPVVTDSLWLTAPVVTLARKMYDGRDFTPMPILADALEEAGCDNLEVLSHCRSTGPHVRGCWVVDLILGKS